MDLAFSILITITVSVVVLTGITSLVLLIIDSIIKKKNKGNLNPNTQNN